jgi:hypothetical protein
MTDIISVGFLLYFFVFIHLIIVPSFGVFLQVIAVYVCALCNIGLLLILSSYYGT